MDAGHEVAPLVADIMTFGQRAEPGKEWLPVGQIDLDFGGGDIWDVKGPDGQFEPETCLIGKWGAAFATKGAAGGIGALKPFRLATGPDGIMRRNQGAEETAKGLLAHAAMTNGRPAETCDAETNRATLAATGMGFSLGHDTLLRYCCHRDQ